jgi:hypothetical protein
MSLIEHICLRYLNCDSVNYLLATENYLMEIKINLQYFSIKFAISRSVDNGREILNLYVREPSGYTQLASDLNNQDEDCFILVVSNYIKCLAGLMLEDGNYIYLKQTDVFDQTHNVTYLNSFLATLNACGYINTFYKEFMEDSVKKVYVYVLPN